MTAAGLIVLGALCRREGRCNNLKKAAITANLEPHPCQVKKGVAGEEQWQGFSR